MTKVLFIVGSLREGSFNQQLAAQAEKVLEGKAEVYYEDIASYIKKITSKRIGNTSTASRSSCS